MNLSETAFLLRGDDGFDLGGSRPVEVELCGHATLASAHFLWQTGRLAAGTTARFHTRSGWLSAEQREGWIELDFPAIPPEQADEFGAALAEAVRPLSAGRVGRSSTWSPD